MYEAQIAFLNKILGEKVEWEPDLVENCLRTKFIPQKKSVELCDRVLKYILDRVNPGELYPFKFIRAVESRSAKFKYRFMINVSDADNLMKLAPESKGTPYVEKNIAELCKNIIAKMTQFAADAKADAERQKRFLRAPTPEGIKACDAMVDYHNGNLPKVMATLETIQSGGTITTEQQALLREYSYTCYMSSAGPMMFAKLFLHIENTHLVKIQKSEPATKTDEKELEKVEIKHAPTEPTQAERDKATLGAMVKAGGITAGLLQGGVPKQIGSGKEKEKIITYEIIKKII